jgi:hypothetical protein
VNHDEAKNILLLYRHGTADADDPQIAGALALAQRDPELARWLEEHCARQFVLREKFRQIAAPAGLREQIISEHAAQKNGFLAAKNHACDRARVDAAHDPDPVLVSASRA